MWKSKPWDLMWISVGSQHRPLPMLRLPIEEPSQARGALPARGATLSDASFQGILGRLQRSHGRSDRARRDGGPPLLPNGREELRILSENSRGQEVASPFSRENPVGSAQLIRLPQDGGFLPKHYVVV